MLTQGTKKNVCRVLIVVALLSVLGNIGTAEGARRIVTMREMMVRQRKVEINGRLFDVEIDQASKKITVRGYVEDWDEMDRVEKYFELRSPSNYQVTCQLDFAY